MLLFSSKEAEQLFRYANKMFMKAKSNIKIWRNVATWNEGVLWVSFIILNFPYPNLYKEMMKQYGADKYL